MSDPDEPRSERALNDAERPLLEAFLDNCRGELLAAVQGLTDEQSRRRLVPSLTTPMALLKHAAWVERVWFQASLTGRSREEIGISHQIDDSFVPSEDDTLASVVEDFRRACAESRAVAATHDLDDHALHNRRGPLSVRWIYVHMIEELARHAGHADILREQIEATDRGQA